uniref:NADH dehydrogenase [ubiquinone] 1 subunit C1, mitochondrial n=1 Tax=Oryzias sinensis TaxID=183150 RepID=A0A8C8DMQ2_9TELE
NSCFDLKSFQSKIIKAVQKSKLDCFLFFAVVFKSKTHPQNLVGSRSAFTSSKTDTRNPNWVRVGLAFGSSAFLWALLFKQHSTDVHEYKVRNGLQ